jgi:thiol-disulfide isomerase/thioredoxin
VVTERLRLAVIAVVAILAAGAYVAWQHYLVSTSPAQSVPPGIAPAALFAADFPDLDGTRRALGEWQGKVLVLNFWATWCEPCREEIPTFVGLQRAYGDRGLAFVGLAIDDKEKVAAYVREVGINYPVLLADSAGMELSRRLGDHAGALPFTAVVDKSGKLAAIYLGITPRQTLEPLLQSLLGR